MTPVAVSPGLHFIGLGLAASAFWGASDFLGGLATRKAHVVLVVAMAHGLSLGLLLLLAWATHSPIPPAHFVFRGLGAGTFGGVALILYYQALSLGEMGITTALTGLLTAMVPVGYSFFTLGSPKFSQIAGFVLAAAAIVLIAYTPLASRPWRVSALACSWWCSTPAARTASSGSLSILGWRAPRWQGGLLSGCSSARVRMR
jgi:drug/metabolite transporter (DMT)-like permease